MKERSILFNAEMVRAVLSGRKTQTRRVLAAQPTTHYDGFTCEAGKYYPHIVRGGMTLLSSEGIKCPFGGVGDQLWVRETFADVNTENGPAFTYRADNRLKFCLDDESPVNYDRYPGKTFAMWCSDLWRGEPGHIWTPSLHMPRWASRIRLEITGVRVERLRDISEADARAEGITDGGCLNCGKSEPCECDNPEPDATDAFACLWQSIYGADNWLADPWVWVIEFKVEGGI